MSVGQYLCIFALSSEKQNNNQKAYPKSTLRTNDLTGITNYSISRANKPINHRANRASERRFASIYCIGANATHAPITTSDELLFSNGFKRRGGKKTNRKISATTGETFANKLKRSLDLMNLN